MLPVIDLSLQIGSYDECLTGTHDKAGSFFRFQDACGVLIDRKHDRLAREQPPQKTEAFGTHEAVAGIEFRSAFVVVPVWQDRQVEPKWREYVQSRLPMEILADLVDLVDRQRETTHRDGGRAGKCQRRSRGMSVADRLQRARSQKLAHGVGRTAGTGKDVVRLV